MVAIEMSEPFFLFSRQTDRIKRKQKRESIDVYVSRMIFLVSVSTISMFQDVGRISAVEKEIVFYYKRIRIQTHSIC